MDEVTEYGPFLDLWLIKNILGLDTIIFKALDYSIYLWKQNDDIVSSRGLCVTSARSWNNLTVSEKNMGSIQNRSTLPPTPFGIYQERLGGWHSGGASALHEQRVWD